jgi:hypothetical protein
MLLQDTLRLCEHVGAVGATQWDVLSAALRCPPALCVLRWHALVLEHARSKSTLKVPKYSDWELCVLMVVSLHGSLSKCSSLLQVPQLLPHSWWHHFAWPCDTSSKQRKAQAWMRRRLLQCVAAPAAAAVSLQCNVLSTDCCHVTPTCAVDQCCRPVTLGWHRT